MKGMFLYLLICLIVFIGVTNVIVYFSERYENIFALDFSPKKSLLQYNISVSEDSVKTVMQTLNREEVFREWGKEAAKPSQDTTVAENTNVANLEQNQTNTTGIDTSQAQKNRTSGPDSLQAVSGKGFNPKDREYIAWREKTIQLYETMDAKKVAQVIQSFSDNIARDLIYSMKKKKAAKVLSFMDPEVVVRLTKVQ